MLAAFITPRCPAQWSPISGGWCTWDLLAVPTAVGALVGEGAWPEVCGLRGSPAQLRIALKDETEHRRLRVCAHSLKCSLPLPNNGSLFLYEARRWTDPSGEQRPPGHSGVEVGMAASGLTE